MRITGGVYRGSIIRAPKSLKVRATTDFTKEALFNILTNSYNFQELEVLDLFAGIGSITYEFASRGTKKIVSVELNQLHYNFIKRELRRFKFNMVELIRRDALEYIANCSSRFHIIFADPPYNAPFIEQLPALILDRGLLQEEGLFILEHSSRHNFSSHPQIVKERRYGDSYLSFFIN
ncbi:MAG: RsmD family RNA methyltransferase, partial [Bacteroidales bacterium]